MPQDPPKNNQELGCHYLYFCTGYIPPLYDVPLLPMGELSSPHRIGGTLQLRCHLLAYWDSLITRHITTGLSYLLQIYGRGLPYNRHRTYLSPLAPKSILRYSPIPSYCLSCVSSPNFLTYAPPRLAMGYLPSGYHRTQ